MAAASLLDQLLRLWRTADVSTRGWRAARDLKNPAAPCGRYGFTDRFRLITLIPKARTISACVQLPLITHGLVNMRKEAWSGSACEKTGLGPEGVNRPLPPGEGHPIV